MSDHAPLLMAVADGLVAPLVIVEPDYWAQPWASARQWRFTARAITALRSQLAVIGAPLIVRTGDAIETITQLQDRSRDVAIWSHDTVGSAWEVDRDARVATWAESFGIPWHRLPDTGGADAAADDPWEAVLAGQVSPPPDLMIAHGVTPGRVVSERILYLEDDACADLPAGPAGARRVLDTFMTAAEADTAGPAEVEEALASLAPHLVWGTLSVREAWLELERLKPDAEAIACALQDRLLVSRAPVGEGANGGVAERFEARSVTVEDVSAAVSETPELVDALADLQARGVIREDLLSRIATEAGARLSVPPQAALDALARLRTAFAENVSGLERLPAVAGTC